METKKKYDSSNFVDSVLRTESMDFEKIEIRLADKRSIRLLHAAIGLATESGEFIDMLKKHIFYGKELDIINAKEELGDIAWYLTLGAQVLGADLNEIFTLNSEKLRKRYPEKFTEEKALNRDIENELSHFKEKE